MSEVRVEINDAELRNILKSGDMQSVCAEQASKSAGRAGAGYATRSHQTATLAIQSYGGTMYQAAVLNETVKQYMDAAVALPQVSSVKLNSDYNYTDTEAKRYRYQAVFDVITFDEV